ncbi:hypothetical protein HDV01_004296, partial [Terramyces sp. JEL0728]
MERIFERFDEYNFETDGRFQKGKSTLTGNAMQIKHFYYSKFFEKFDLQMYLEWKNTLATVPTEPPVIEKQEDEGPKLSFQDIMDKIQRGEEIPGIKQIPTTVHES